MADVNSIQSQNLALANWLYDVQNTETQQHSITGELGTNLAFGVPLIAGGPALLKYSAKPYQAYKEMKNSQEEEVKKLLDEMYYPKTKVVVFESPIKNKLKAKVDFKKACEAIRESKKKSDDIYPLTINLECEEHDYNSNEFWKSIEGKLERVFSKK